MNRTTVNAGAMMLAVFFNAAAGAVDLGGSGTAPSGNRTPDFHGYNLFTTGALWQELGRDISTDPVDPEPH